MSSKLQSAMESLIKVFHSYSGKEGDKYKLSNREMRNLLHGELEMLAVSSSMTLFQSKLFQMQISIMLFGAKP